MYFKYLSKSIFPITAVSWVLWQN